MNIRVGILGYGFMGHVHAKMIQDMEGMELVAVCDIDKNKLVDAPTNVNISTHMDTFFLDNSMDTVIIAVPNHLHLEAVCKAAKAKKDIICEKPAAMNALQFDEMMQAVKDNDVRFTVHQQRRFDTDFRIAKEVYDHSMVGDMYTIQTGLYGINGNMHDWHVYKKYGGGMLYDWGVHLIDQMLWMVDSKIKTVFADVRNVINNEVDDYFKILLRFENGIVGEIELGTYFLANKEKWFERHWYIGGSTGSMYLDGFEPEGNICRTTRLLESVPNKTTMSASGPTRSFGPPAPGVLITEKLPSVDVNHKMFFENYVKAVAGKEELLVTPDEVRRVLSLMEVVRKSATLGKSIDFE